MTQYHPHILREFPFGPLRFVSLFGCLKHGIWLLMRVLGPKKLVSNLKGTDLKSLT